jgi:hypothetical protein
MQPVFYKLFRSLLLGLAISCALPSAIPAQSLDSLYHDTAQVNEIEETATPINGEYTADEYETEPERPVTYNSSSPNDAQWAQATEKKVYNYRDKREYTVKKTPERESWWVTLLKGIIAFIVSPFGQLLLWLSLIAIVGYIAYRIISGQGGWIFGAKDKKLEEAESIDLSEQSLLEKDWEAKLRTAMDAGDTRLAIRYSYLRLLQLLQEHALITYSPEKTNKDYYRELAEKPQRQPFRTMARQYEYAWYGNYLPEAPALEQYMQTFRQVKQSLGTA